MPCLRSFAAIAALAVLTSGCYRADAVTVDLPDDSGTWWDEHDGTNGGSDSDSDADADGDADTDDPPGADWVGAPCQPPESEGDEDPCPALTADQDSFCFAWTGAPGGICTKECTAATYEVPVQEGCPSFDGYVCMDISGLTADPADDEVGYNICVEECLVAPLGQPGPCMAEYIACDPRSWAWESQFATCLMPKCQSDADCPVVSGPECTGDGDCDATEDEHCSDDGLCVFEATCDVESGRCTWQAGDADAEPGDPCETTHDCNANAICLLPFVDGDGKIVPAGGYCATHGCKAANSAASNGSGSADPAVQDEFSCGMLGTCHSGFPYGGMCLKRCNPPHDQDAFRCRQQSWTDPFLDISGDYDCYDGTGYGYYIPVSGNTEFYSVASAPYCSWVSRASVHGVINVKCGNDEDEGEMTPQDCADHFGGNPTPWGLGMTCRNAETGELDDFGYCLDNTTSGPNEDWGGSEPDTD